jgi:hypothetical protein
VSLFRCRACVSKDTEIQLLTGLLQAWIDRAERLQGEILNLARETKGLPPVVMQAPSEARPPLHPDIEVFLDARFVRGTPLWKQQTREALKLAAELERKGKAPDEVAQMVTDTLSRGQRVEF